MGCTQLTGAIMRVSTFAAGLVSLAALAAYAVICPPAIAAEEPATTAFVLAPAAPPAAPGSMPVIITAVHGLVQYRDDDSQPWHIATAQAQISQGAELRTGPHSSVTCVIPPDQTFTLDRLGTVRVQEAAKHGNKISTDLLMKYGRTHYEIEAAGLEHEAKISSPSSTLAVRGTVVSLYDQPPFKPEAVSFTGRAQFTYLGNTVPVGQKHGSVTKLLAGADGASQTGVDDTVVDPQVADARSQADAALIATEVSRGAVLSYDPIANIPVITNGTPLYDSQVPSHLPGDLNFVLRWTGNANLNIEVAVDIGAPLTILSTTGFVEKEFLYPGYGYQDSPSGGHVPFDNRGGPKGGEEFAYWSGPFPQGIYGFAAVNLSKTATSATLDVYENGKPLEMFTSPPTTSSAVLYKSTQYTRTIPGGGNFAALLSNALIPPDPAGDPNPGINPPASSASLARAASAERAVPAILKVPR
jgi:hypothetical protein